MKILWILIASLGIFAQDGGKKALTVDGAQPVVVKTMPQAGSVDVDPSLKEIRVVFSKDMLTEKAWAVAPVDRESFPKLTGEVHFVDKRTFSVPVALEPGKTYGIWFNTRKQGYFRDPKNNSSVPYLLVFKTKDAKPSK